tara:strand:- start:7061 stop:7813 length:753 start_codon:yes stop_codon:yes gene_type:complete
MRENILFSGTLRHRRFIPKVHEFTYKVFYFYFNINELASLCDTISFLSQEKFNYLSFYRKNYIGDASQPISETVNKLLSSQNTKPSSDVFMMTQLSHLGFCFNPISLYFTYQDDMLQSLIADVQNTPWGEKHPYVLTNPNDISHQSYAFQFLKKLHVSPFFDMRFVYDLNLKLTKENFIVHMQNMKDDIKHFDVTLSMQGVPFSANALKKLIVKHPFVSQKIILSIYWQALKLYIKRIPFVSHPKYNGLS